MATPQAGKLTHTQPPMHFSLRTISNTVCAYVAGIKMVHQMAAGTRWFGWAAQPSRRQSSLAAMPMCVLLRGTFCCCTSCRVDDLLRKACSESHVGILPWTQSSFNNSSQQHLPRNCLGRSCVAGARCSSSRFHTSVVERSKPHGPRWAWKHIHRRRCPDIGANDDGRHSVSTALVLVAAMIRDDIPALLSSRWKASQEF